MTWHNVLVFFAGMLTTVILRRLSIWWFYRSGNTFQIDNMDRFK